MEFLLIILSLVIAAVLFTGWVFFAISRGLVRLLIPKRRPVISPMNAQRCNNPKCCCDNPTYARYCRRCGKSLPNLLRLVSSRAAML